MMHDTPFRHLPYEHGCATILYPCAPRGRSHKPTGYVAIFRTAVDGNEYLAERASFLEPGAIFPWIAETIGRPVASPADADTQEGRWQRHIAKEALRLGLITAAERSVST